MQERVADLLDWAVRAQFVGLLEFAELIPALRHDKVRFFSLGSLDGLIHEVLHEEMPAGEVLLLEVEKGVSELFARARVR